MNVRAAEPTLNTHKFHVYNQRFALTAESGTNRAGSIATVTMEIAERERGGRGYLWSDKTAVQLTDLEMPEVIATLLGWRSVCQFSHHGPNRDKSIRVARDAERQRVVVQVSRPDVGRRTVALIEAEQAALAALVFSQYARNRAPVEQGPLFAMLQAVFRGSPGRPPPPDIGRTS